MSKLKLVLVNVLVLVGMYGVLELSYSAYSYFFRDSTPKSFWVYEHPGETIRFDADRGFFLTQTPSRWARITYGRIEYSGCVRGNAQGFPDRNDFTIRRTTPGQKRIAILGDSFTAEQYISVNWPNRVEELTGTSPQPPVLFNFSVDGAGLANWASVMRNIVAKDNYELDGIIFAVAWDDLDRKFTMFDQIDSKTLAFARAPSWDVASQPRTIDQALPLIRSNVVAMATKTYILSPTELDAALSGRWRPRQWRFRITERLSAGVRQLCLRFQTKKTAPSGFEPGQLALIEEIHRLAREHSWPIAVVYIPFRDELLDPNYPSNLERTRQFAALLGAKVIDGRQAFLGVSPQQINADWFEHDGHWNQSGSDKFADFMAAQIPDWVASNTMQTASVHMH
jgi:hypothetical protein